MKKIFIIIMSLMLITGCSKEMNTPTSKVERFINDYQNLSDNVIDNLEKSIKKEDLTEKQKKKYQTIMEKQYQNLSYKITDEEIINDTAIVNVEIEVLNYSYSLSNSKKYYEEHKEEIKNYNDYKLKELEKVEDKIKYNIVFSLTEFNGVWELNELDKNDLKKIHGLVSVKSFGVNN